MSLQKPEVIDLVGLSADGETVTLFLIATEPWPSTGEGAVLLHAKLKNYVAFAADGQLASDYPEARGKKIVVEIRSDHPLGATEQKLVAAALEHWCQPEGIALTVSTKHLQ